MVFFFLLLLLWCSIVTCTTGRETRPVSGKHVQKFICLRSATDQSFIQSIMVQQFPSAHSFLQYLLPGERWSTEEHYSDRSAFMEWRHWLGSQPKGLHQHPFSHFGRWTFSRIGIKRLFKKFASLRQIIWTTRFNLGYVQCFSLFI